MPTPYQLDFFQELGKLFDLHVVYFTEREKDRQWQLPDSGINYTTKTLKNGLLARIIQKKIVSFHFSRKIIGLLKNDPSPYIIVNGTYWSPNTVLVMMISYWKKKKVFLYAEPVFPARGLQFFVKKNLLMLPLRFCTHGILAIGKKAEEGYASYGYKQKIYNVPYNIDIKVFDRSLLNAQRLQELREKYQLKDETVLLSSGMLIERKGMDTVIKAYKKAKQHKKTRLFILGDGSERQKLESLAGNDPDIHFVGFQEKRDVPYYFGLADIFVFASRYDGWGLVINEAIAAGLAIICSEETGAATDKLIHNYNALLCRAEATDDFARYIRSMLNDVEKRRKLVDNCAVAKEELSSEYNAHKVSRILLNE